MVTKNLFSVKTLLCTLCALFLLSPQAGAKSTTKDTPTDSLAPASLGGVAFATERLRTMAVQCRLDGASLSAIPVSGKDSMTFVYRGRRLAVKKNALGDISHIGYWCFPQALRDFNPSPVYDFLERYALELDLAGQTRDIKIYRDQMTAKGDWNALTAAGDINDFSLRKEGLKKYYFNFKRGGRSLQLAFACDCQLLMGCDAIELERNFVRDIKRTAPNLKLLDLPQPESAGDSTKQQANYRVLGGKDYLSPSIHNSIYLRLEKTGGKKTYALIADTMKLVQSVGNMLLTGISKNHVNVALKVDKYGYACDSLLLPLASLVTFLQQEGCELYFGVKERKGDDVLCSVFALQRDYGYNHVISFRVPKSTLVQGGTVEARAFCYVPLHNVTEKFLNLTPSR